MVISKIAQDQIYKLIDVIVTLYISRASKDSTSNSGNPFVAALLDDFEPLLHRIHGLKTSLGNEMEKIAEIIAIDAWGIDNVQRKIKRDVKLPVNVMQAIDSIIFDLSNARKLSNYKNEIEKVLDACNNPSKKIMTGRLEFDLELKNPEKNKIYFLEMKGPDPNTTEVPGAKRRLLMEFAWGFFNTEYKNFDSILAVYYSNVYPKPYKNPKVLGYFDPDGGLLIHDDFWNFVGENKETYTELIKVFKKYGDENKERIWNEFSKLIKVRN